jgi:hypothetical protein
MAEQLCQLGQKAGMTLVSGSPMAGVILQAADIRIQNQNHNVNLQFLLLFFLCCDLILSQKDGKTMGAERKETSKTCALNTKAREKIPKKKQNQRKNHKSPG